MADLQFDLISEVSGAVGHLFTLTDYPTLLCARNTAEGVEIAALRGNEWEPELGIIKGDDYTIHHVNAFDNTLCLTLVDESEDYNKDDDDDMLKHLAFKITLEEGQFLIEGKDASDDDEFAFVSSSGPTDFYSSSAYIEWSLDDSQTLARWQKQGETSNLKMHGCCVAYIVEEKEAGKQHLAIKDLENDLTYRKPCANGPILEISTLTSPQSIVWMDRGTAAMCSLNVVTGGRSRLQTDLPFVEDPDSARILTRIREEEAVIYFVLARSGDDDRVRIFRTRCHAKHLNVIRPASRRSMQASTTSLASHFKSNNSVQQENARLRSDIVSLQEQVATLNRACQSMMGVVTKRT